MSAILQHTLRLTHTLVLLRIADAADEWGIMVSPELPCAYGNFFKAGNATAQALYLASWTSYIGAYRNHPSGARTRIATSARSAC
eukprot:COSAG05_NODE_1078_length_5954_cov_7.170794_4_plen_85_part_00